MVFVLGIPVSYRDVESIDPEYAKNLQVRERGRRGGDREEGEEERKCQYQIHTRGD